MYEVESTESRRKYRNHENRLKTIKENTKQEVIRYKNFLGRTTIWYLCNYCYLNHFSF